MNRKENLIWIDLEMTGLNPDRDRIIEIATVVTDKELTVLAEGPVCAIHQTDDVLAAMDELEHAPARDVGSHGARAREHARPSTKPSRRRSRFLRKHVDQGASPICGNSICQDRRFLSRHMPELAAYFPLPQPRRVDAQDPREAVAARDREPVREELRASRARRYSRLDSRAAFLSRAPFQAVDPARAANEPQSAENESLGFQARAG